MKDAVQPFFMGYADLAQMIPVLSRERPVYVIATVDPGKATSSGLRIDRLQVVVTQVDPTQAMAHYCLLVLGAEQMVGSSPLNVTSYSQRKAQSEQIAGLISGWLTAQGYTVSGGMLAMPTGVRYLDGWWSALAFDQRSQAYCLEMDQETPTEEDVL